MILAPNILDPEAVLLWDASWCIMERGWEESWVDSGGVLGQDEEGIPG